MVFDFLSIHSHIYTLIQGPLLLCACYATLTVPFFALPNVPGMEHHLVAVQSRSEKNQGEDFNERWKKIGLGLSSYWIYNCLIITTKLPDSNQYLTMICHCICVYKVYNVYNIYSVYNVYSVYIYIFIFIFIFVYMYNFPFFVHPMPFGPGPLDGFSRSLLGSSEAFCYC